MARVILEMDVHCTDCAKKIRKAVQNNLGVQKVRASPETGLVVVTGTADARALRRRLERKLERPVKIVSDDMVAPEEPVDREVPAGWSENHWVPPPESFPQPYIYGAPQLAYPPYAGINRWAPPPRWHVSHGVPARHQDYEEGPQSCCSIQ